MGWKDTTSQKLYDYYIEEFPKIEDYWEIPSDLEVRKVGGKELRHILTFYNDNSEKRMGIFDYGNTEGGFDPFLDRIERETAVPFVIVDNENRIAGAMFILIAERIKTMPPQCAWICTDKDSRGMGLAFCLYLAAFKYLKEKKYDTARFVTKDPRLSKRLVEVFGAVFGGDTYHISLK